MVWLPAAAETLVGILKRVIVSPTVYPRFLEIAEFARLSAIDELLVLISYAFVVLQ